MQKLEIKQRPLLTRPENLAGVPAFVAEILARRGVESEQELELKLKHLLAPTMKGLPEAIQLMDQAIDNSQKIVIVGDYDADGATSTALMVLALRDMGANVEYLVPDRFKYGYGLTPAIADLAFVNFTPDLLITVDNGISSHDGVKQAQDHGMPSDDQADTKSRSRGQSQSARLRLSKQSTGWGRGGFLYTGQSVDPSQETGEILYGNYQLS